MSNEFTFTLNSLRFDENYQPLSSTRATTNFANLARGENRQQNLRNALAMINQRFNALANWDNPGANRYELELDIISVDMQFNNAPSATENALKFPAIEVLQTTILDKQENKRIEGILGNNFSSYVRDYDFSVLLRNYNEGKAEFSVPADFGELHGKLFKSFINSDTYKQNFTKLPVICLSVSENKVYSQTTNKHPILGVEYLPNEVSLTEDYFRKMGLEVRYFMPQNCTAPLAFYFYGDLLNDYTHLELISTISTMEAFQKIYRPEIYNTNAIAGKIYQPSLTNPDYSQTKVEYDREERTQLAIAQGKFTEENFMLPYKNLLETWAASYAA